MIAVLPIQSNLTNLAKRGPWSVVCGPFYPHYQLKLIIQPPGFVSLKSNPGNEDTLSNTI